MKYDAKDIEGPLKDYDICIIGSGAAGISIAHKFIDRFKPGGNAKFKVIVLEGSKQGRANPLTAERALQFQRTEFPKLGQAQHRHEDPVAQTLYAGYLNNESSEKDRDAAIFLLGSRVRYFGGTTNCWGGWTRPLDAKDFDRNDVGVQQWPINLGDLEDYYNEAISTYCSLGDWEASEYNHPEFWITKTDRTIALLELQKDSLLRTGIFTQVDSSRWNFQDVWGGDIASAENVDLYLNANVRRLIADNKTIVSVDGSTIDGRKEGKTFSVVRPRYVVVAAGCIETTRLLAFNKLGDPNFVGPRLITHPLGDQAATFDMKVDVDEAVRLLYSGVLKNGEYYAKVVEGSNKQYPARIFAALFPKDTTMRDERIGNFRAIIGFNAKDKPGNVNFMCEQFPDRNNSVGQLGKDPIFGDSTAAVNLRWDRPKQDDPWTRSLNLVRDELVTGGFAKDGTFKITSNPIELSGEHAMGTTPMSLSADNGAVDSNCKLYSTKNLYIASSSVFRSGGTANPTLTVVALSLRLANHLSTMPQIAD